MSGECQICNEHCLDCRRGCQILGCDSVGGRFSFPPPSLGEPIPEYVNHPNHYQGNSIEVIDVIEDFKLGFNLGNAIKYILRSEKKSDKHQDLKKSIWYLQRELERK